MPKKITSMEEWHENANRKFNNKFWYIINDDWVGVATTKLYVGCPIHYLEYGLNETTPFGHLKTTHGCKRCVDDNCRKSLTQFIKEAQIHHGNFYDYSKVNYKNKETKVCIICPVHGEFWQTPHDHIRPYGCAKCADDNARIGYDEFVRRSNIKHNNKYDYSRVVYHRSDERVCIICPRHGEFWQFATGHMHGGNGCLDCSREDMYQSKPVQEIAKFLTENNYNFIQEKSFPDCINENTLPFDFYLDEYNLCIEYDGQQHFEPIEFFGGKEKFIKQQKNDQIKNQYCKNNNINLLRIRYDEDAISKLKKYFNKE